MGPEAVDIVLLFYVNNFFRGSNSVDGQVVVTAIPEDDKSSVNLAQEQVQGDVAIGHGDDGVNGIGITAADQVAEFLANDVDGFTIVVLRGKLLHLLGHEVADTTEFLVAEGVRGISPSSVRMGMFCKFGFDDDSLPVAAPVWLKLVCSRPVCGSISAGSASTYVPFSFVSRSEERRVGKECR